GYSFVLLMFGFAFVFLGGRPMRVLWFPLGYLAFMLPMPPYLMNVVSFRLKLLAAQVGSAIAVKMGIPLARSGMTIHIPAGSLRVADPCSGLRSLIALAALGALFAYFTNGKVWKRIVLFLVAIPLAVLANTIRIAVLCAVANVWGIDTALGFFHDFSGFFLFFIALGGLFVVRKLLRCGGDGESGESSPERDRNAGGSGVADAAASAPNPDASSAATGVASGAAGGVSRGSSRGRVGLVIVVALLAATAVYVQFAPERGMALKDGGLAHFPTEIGEWRSSDLKFADVVYDELDADDTLVREYLRDDGELVWFVIIYHENERYGAHDPMVCYHAQGWEVGRTGLPTLAREDRSFDANWALVRANGRERLAAYWWYAAGDLATADRDKFLARMASAGIRENVTFGAFIRVSCPVDDGDVESALALIRAFAEEAQPRLSELFADNET
ncbi:EpsI family protein, partial [bacterium]|nr:EpsI family protein [bacterium]